MEISISLFPNCEKCVNNINVYKLDIRAHIIFDKINESDLLGGRLRLRSRLPGDKILSGGHHKSVKKLMCDRGLPVAARDILPMLCLDGEIVWIPSVASGDLIKCRYFDEMR